MNKKCGIAILILFSPILASAATPLMTVEANPGKIPRAGTSSIFIRVTNDGQPVLQPIIKAEIPYGFVCGTVSAPSTSADGTTTVTFTGGTNVDNCVATVRLIASTGPNTPTAVMETKITVNPDSVPQTRIDGVSAIALILIVSFAIDRLIRGLFFLLSYSRAWSNAFPDPELNDVAPSARAERNRKLIYFSLAALLAMVALGWFGRVRILAALGFTAVNPVLDIIVTGLILMGGADRAGQLLQSVGGPGAQGSKPQPTPIEITGRVTIDEQSRRTLAVEPGDSTRGPQATHD